MPIEFTCSCGQILRVGDDAEEPAIVCPNCQKWYASKPPEKSVPLHRSWLARAGAWGCLMPSGAVLLLGGTRALIYSGLTTTAGAETAGGVALLIVFAWLLHANKTPFHSRIAVGLALLALFFCIAGPASLQARRDAELCARFASIIDESKAPEKTDTDAPASFRAKCLPVVLTGRGCDPLTNRRVFVDLFYTLPGELRADRPEEVKTFIVVDWWYHYVGDYVSRDVMRDKSGKIYRGGCTLTLVDRATHKTVHEYTFMSKEDPPKLRPGEDLSDWYSSQPTESEVLEYVVGLKFK